MVKRLEQWPRLLSDYLKECYSKPFKWGEHDCLHFSAKCVERLTGENLYADFPTYSTEEEAVSLLKCHGGIIKIISNALGHHGTHIHKTAARGDVCIAKLPHTTSGIVDDTGQRIVVVTPEGLKRYPLATAQRIWGY